MSAHHCEECWAVLDPAKILRCTKCKACRYCSRGCQKRNWQIHKHVCSTDPLLRQFVPMEMAIERALAKQPPMEQAPKGAFCYICFEGDGASASSKLMRGCACRGDSAGFVHLECLTELAMSKDGSGDRQAVYDCWNKCGNCKQVFQGILWLEMYRRFWRRYRSSQDLDLRYNSTRNLAITLGRNGEVNAANHLLDEASIYVANGEQLLELKLLRATALGLLQAMLPEAKECTDARFYSKTLQEAGRVLLGLDRNQEAHEMAIEHVAFAKAKFGLEDSDTVEAVFTYAITCAKLGRVDEAKANIEDVITIETRVLGPDHPLTQNTRECIQFYGTTEPSG